MADGAKFEMEFSGFGAGWTDVTAHYQTETSSPAPEIDYGIEGVGPNDRVGKTGTFAFTLQNSPTPANPSVPIGYYSLEHANKRAGFGIGIRVRASYTIGATTYYKFIGRLSSAVPTGGSTPRLTRITAVDWFDSAARARLTTLAMQTNKRADELLTLVLGAMADQPVSTSFDTGSETYVLALDETVQAITEAQKIADSEFGLIYLKGDTTGGGKLVLESRTKRLVAGAAVAAFTDSNIRGIQVGYDQAEILNVVRSVTHPRTQDAAATTVLYQLRSTPLVTAGATFPISGNYTDPNQRAVRVSGKDMVPPVATTHYTMNSASDGTGTNLTANFAVAATYTGSAVFYTITNNGAVDGYVTLLKAVGRGIYDFEPVEAKAILQSSIDTYGEQDANIDQPYQSDTAIGAAVAGFVRTRYSSPIGPSGVRVLCLGGSAADLLKVISLEPGDRVTVQETQTGLNITGFINHVKLTLGLIPSAEFLIYRAEPVGYWNLQHAGLSELDDTTRLAPL